MLREHPHTLRFLLWCDCSPDAMAALPLVLAGVCRFKWFHEAQAFVRPYASAFPHLAFSHLWL